MSVILTLILYEFPIFTISTIIPRQCFRPMNIGWENCLFFRKAVAGAIIGLLLFFQDFWDLFCSPPPSVFMTPSTNYMLLYSTLLCKKITRAPGGHKKCMLTKLGGGAKQNRSDFCYNQMKSRSLQVGFLFIISGSFTELHAWRHFSLLVERLFKIFWSHVN